LARRVPAPPFRAAVYRLVRRIPPGRVATYGQVAAGLGHPRAARAVGTALHWLPRELLERVPWQRVINAAGGISYRGDIYRPDLQRRLLEDEGVVFDAGGHVDLRRFRWRGPRREQTVRLEVFDRDEAAASSATATNKRGLPSGAAAADPPCAAVRRRAGRRGRGKTSAPRSRRGAR